ncbi:MAG TPA: potassium-transporting ATPase subunit F [Thermoplasmata archaeon]|nr:potassium-transporting ATPase subunit F [Thermoplasmata archaeon]
MGGLDGSTFDLGTLGAIVIQHLGLVVFSALALALVAYLIYTMLHPEAF